MKSMQVLSSFLVNVLALGTGASYGIANVMLAKLDAAEFINNSNSSNITGDLATNKSRCTDPFWFTITSDEASWIASFSMIGQYFPIFFVGPIVGKFGKRISMLIDCIIFMCGFLLMGLSVGVTMLYASKFFLGYAYLTSRSSIQPFICEISDPSIRGFTSTLWALCFSSGQALSILAANQLGWRYVSGFFAALMVVCFLGLLLIHETPDWLLEKKYFDKAIKSLEFYQVDPKLLVADKKKRTSSTGYKKGYRELIGFYRKESATFSKSIKIQADISHQTWRDKASAKKAWILNVIKKPEVYKPFAILTIIFGLLELSGFAVLANYSIVLVKKYGYGPNTFVDAGTLITIISLTRIPVSFIAMPALQKCKKRPLYLGVCVFLLLVLSALIAFTHLVEKGDLTQEDIQKSIGLQMVPFILFILMYAAFSFGYGIIPFALMGELFPPSVSTLANTAIFVLVNSIEMTAVKTALLIRDEHGLQYLFVIPLVAILTSAIFAVIFMPETHGLSLKEIGKIYGEGECEVEDEEVPYFQSLRGEALESSKIIFRMATMIIWSPDVGGVVKMSDTAKPKLRRSQTERHIRKITPAARFISLQFPSRDS